MPNYFARASGNINATNVWATTPTGTAGAQTFVAGDVLYANNFTITVNVTTSLGSTGEVRNDNTNGATAGGGFVLSNGVTLTANVFSGTGNAVAVSFAGTSGNSASIVGNITAGSGNDGARNSSSGTLNITGNVTGTTANAFAAASNTSTGIINITGNATGGSATNAFAVDNSGTGTINITGNVTGGSGATSYGARNNSTGTLTITGSVFGSNAAAGAQNASTGILNVIRAVGNDWGIGATGMTSQVGVISSVAGSQTRVEEFEYGLLGQAPTSGAVSCPNLTTNVCLVHRLSSAKKTLIDAASVSGALPSASDVRFGTTFNQGSTTGTLRVPAAGSVALGVLVDNTSGTAVLTPSAVWNALTSGMTTAGSIGERLKNAATVGTTGQALADALTPVP